MSIDLTTNYGGLRLTSPIVAGACPLMAKEALRRSAEFAGAGALVLPSLFDEQVSQWNQVNRSGAAGPNPVRADPVWHDGSTYLAFVNRASTQASIPVIASLNGYRADQWIEYASELEEAGAAAIELCIHHGPVHRFQDPREIEQQIVSAVREINAAVNIPLFVKLNDQYTSISHLAQQLQSGVQGLVLFGRRPHVDISVDDFQVKSQWGLTPTGSITESLGTIMQVHAHCPSIPLAASGGIGSCTDVIKAILAGAEVAMVTSAIYREGTDVLRQIIDGLRHYMNANHLTSINDLTEQRPLRFGTHTERSEYIKALSSRPDFESSSR